MTTATPVRRALWGIVRFREIIFLEFLSSGITLFEMLTTYRYLMSAG